MQTNQAIIDIVFIEDQVLIRGGERYPTAMRPLVIQDLLISPVQKVVVILKVGMVGLIGVIYVELIYPETGRIEVSEKLDHPTFFRFCAGRIKFHP